MKMYENVWNESLRVRYPGLETRNFFVCFQLSCFNEGSCTSYIRPLTQNKKNNKCKFRVSSPCCYFLLLIDIIVTFIFLLLLLFLTDAFCFLLILLLLLFLIATFVSYWYYY